MTALLYISVRRYIAFFFISAVIISAAFYLIMVNVVYSKILMIHYQRAHIPGDYSISENRHVLHNRDVYSRFNSTRNSNINRQRRKHVNNIINSSHNSNIIKQERKVILLWSSLFDDWNFLKVGNHSFEEFQCPETRCEIIDDRSRLLESDAVLFHIRTLSMLDLPRNRTREQKWIFFSLEAPPYSRFQGFDFMVGMFNWTMTYRRDSDVYIPYGRIVPKFVKSFNKSELYIKWKEKSKMAVWMVSHCSTAGNREKYIRHLKIFMDVDTYGSCGLGTCPFNKTNQCIENFSRQYYFFLAFENAICVDYITEKLFRTLRYDMIPVVFGGGNYTATAPPNSFIDALKFKSLKRLSSHLFKIASNFTLFSSFFKWRKASYSEDTPNHCDLCQKLHSADFKLISVYPNIDEWWVKKSNCKRWQSKMTVE